MKQNDWERAIEEFKSAVSLEFEDAKRKRTYGTRFIQYFPHREMGIAYYNLGEHNKALDELKLSVVYKRSRRAYIFINIMTEENSDVVDEDKIIQQKKAEEERQAALEQERLAYIQNQEEEKKKKEEQKKKQQKIIEDEKIKKKYEQEQLNKIKVPIGALTYDPSMVTQVGSRLSVAVLPFDGKGEAKNLSQTITDKMITQLVNLRRFRVIERNALVDVMKEQSFGLSGMVDEQTAVKVGKLVGADVIIFGSVILETNFGKVTARVINTETSETIIAKESQTENTKLENIEKLVENVAIMIYNELPLVEGNIVNIEDDLIYIDIGCDVGIRKGTKCVAFSEGDEIVHPVSKEVLGRKVEKRGEIIVFQVQDKMSIARILNEEGKIKIGDKVVVK